MLAIIEVKMKPHEKNLSLQKKYNVTGLLYDILDYPWEQRYKKWRPTLVGDLKGKVLEAGVGTGRNLEFYHEDVDMVGIELSKQMLRKAEKRIKKARCKVKLIYEDATVMQSIGSNQFDWIFSTFMCCVMPDDIQTLAIEQFGRVLKKGGRFRLLEIVFSKNKELRKPLILSIYVNEYISSHIERSHWENFEKSNENLFDNMSPICEIVFWPLVNNEVFSIR